MSGTLLTQNEAPPPVRTPWWRSAVFGVLLSAVVCVVVLAFSWPSVTLSPKDVPIAVAGPEDAVAPIEQALEEQGDGAFDLVKVSDRTAAVNAIESRDVYGAIVLGTSPEVLTASGAGSATSGMMTQIHSQLQTMVEKQAAAAAKAQGADPVPEVKVALTDVVPLVDSDERGVGLASAALPLVFGGMIGGIGIAFAVSGAWRRVAALFVYGIIGGLAIGGIMQGWFGFLGGSYWAVSGAFGLTLLAMGAVIVGFAALWGRAGIAVGPVLFMLIGNPLSGAQFPQEFLPVPWGAVGQWLPPGAGNTLLRNASYFPDANSSFPILVLTGWAVLGLVFVLIGHYRDQARLTVEEEPTEVTGSHVGS